jgi:hypothetical protein
METGGTVRRAQYQVSLVACTDKSCSGILLARGKRENQESPFAVITAAVMMINTFPTLQEVRPFLPVAPKAGANLVVPLKMEADSYPALE